MHLVALLEQPEGVHVGGQVLHSRPAAKAHAADEEDAGDGGIQEVRPQPAANPGRRRLQALRACLGGAVDPHVEHSGEHEGREPARWRNAGWLVLQ